MFIFSLIIKRQNIKGTGKHWPQNAHSEACAQIEKTCFHVFIFSSDTVPSNKWADANLTLPVQNDLARLRYLTTTE